MFKIGIIEANGVVFAFKEWCDASNFLTDLVECGYYQDGNEEKTLTIVVKEEED